MPHYVRTVSYSALRAQVKRGHFVAHIEEVTLSVHPYMSEYREVDLREIDRRARGREIKPYRICKQCIGAGRVRGICLNDD